ncbi:MAG: GAF domain-containing protein [Candidatus Rokuibacteriota bacterium]
MYRLDGDVLAPVAHRGMTPAELAHLGARPLVASHAGEAVRAGRPVVTELRRSRLLDPDLLEVARAAGRRLQVALPIVADGVPWGALTLLWGARREPAGEELRLLGAVAQQIGLAVVRASLETVVREKGRRLEALTRLGRTLAATLSLDDLLRHVADAAVEVFGASEARIWLVDAGAATVSLGAQSPAAAPAAGPPRLAAGEGLVGAVIASRAPLVIADLASDARVPDAERARATGLASFAGVPLTLGEQLLGALTIATRARHASTDEEMALLQSLASHAAAAIDSVRRFAAGARDRDQLAALLEINKRIAAAESPEALLGAIAEEAARLLEVDNAGFRLVDGDDLVLAGLAGTAGETMLRPRIRIGESLSGRVVREGRTIVAALGEAYDLVPEHRQADQRLGYAHFLGVPLRAGERIIGVLTFRARRPFTARDRTLAEAFAGQAALALEHARLYREASRQLERMAALADVERLLTETLEPDVVAQRIADSLPLLVQAHAAGVYRLEPESGALVALSVSSPAGRPAPWNLRLPAGHGAVGLAVRDGRPIVTTDLATDPRITLTPESRAIVEAGPHRAVLAMPLVIRDRVIGGISVGHHEQHVFDEEDVRLVQAFANQAAVALENARLFGEAARQAERMAALADVERLLSEALDPEVVAQRIVDSVCSLLGARSAALYGVEAESGALVADTVSRDVGATFYWTRRLPPGHGLVGLAIAERRPAVAADVLTDPRLRYGDDARAAVAAATHRSLVAVPLLAGDRVLGALAVGDATGRVFAAEELRLARAFADQAALALENARLFSLETARRSQIEALAAVERELAAELDRERLLHLIIDRASGLFSGYGSIYLLEDGARLVRTAWSGLPVGDGELPLGTGVSGACAAGRRGLLVNDYAPSPYAVGAFAAAGTSRVMAQPLVAGDRLLGVVTMSRRGAGAPPFSADDLAVLESFANQTAIALENARLHGEARRGRDEARELARVAGSLTESLEVSAVGARIVDSVLTLLSAKSAGLRLLAPDGSLVVVAWRGPEGASFEMGHEQPMGTGLAGQAIAEARAVWSADVGAGAGLGVTDDMRERLTRYGHRAVLAVPLFAKGRTIGVLIVADAAPRTFSDAEVALARGFADQAALALDNARLHEEAELRRREAEFLADLARTINSSLDLGLVLQRITEGAQELCASDLARIALREPGTEQFVYRHWIGARYDGYDGFRIRPGLGASGIVIATGRPFRSDDHVADPRITRVSTDVVRAEGMVTGLTVPICIGERVEGLLSVHNRAPRPFTDRDEAILVQLADHAAIAIQNASLYESVETRAARLRTLADVNRVVSSSLDTGEVLHAIARAASELMDRAFVAFWVADETARTLTFGVVSDPTVAADPPITALAFGEGVVGQAAAERRTIDVPDVAASERFRAPEWARAHGIVGFRAVPILLQGTLLGVLALGAGHPLRFDADDEALLDSFVAQAAVALDHARLYAETRRRLAETRALLEVAEILNSTLDPRQLLKRAAIKIAQVCGVNRCTLELWDGDRVIPLMSQFADGHRDEAMWRAFLSLRPYSPREVPAQARALETRRPVVIEDTTATDQLPREWMETYGHKSYMVVPLIRQDQVMGVLTLDYTERVTPFQDWQVSRATAIAGQLALALANARLYAEAQERLRETSTLLAVGQALSRPAPVEEGMRELAREVARATGADVAAVCVLDETGRALRAIAGYHVPPELRAVFERQPIVLERFPLVREAAAAGRAVWSADPATDERFDAAWAVHFLAHSVLFAPARVRGETNGGLFLVWSQPDRALEPAVIRLVEGVAAQVGLALDNAALALQREERLRETETLLAVSRALSSTLDPDQMLRQFMRQIAGAVGADTLGVWMLDESGEWMTPVAGYRVPRVDEARRLRVSIVEHAFYAEAARQGRPVFTNDAASDPRLPRHLLEAFPHRSQLFAPVLAKDRMIGGFVALWWERSRTFTDRDLALVEAIASQAGVAIENARLFQENRRQVEELSMLHELSRAVTGQLDREPLLETIRVNVLRGLAAQKIVVLLLDEKTDEFEVALRAMDGADSALPRRYPRSVGLASVVLDTGRTFRTDDYGRECARRGLERPPAGGPRHWVGAPMRAGDGMLGVLTASREDRPFTDADERLLGNIADLAALALRSAWLFEERTRAYGELAAAQDHLVRTEKLRALGEMASGVAHDFNNLLAAILGRTQLLLRRVDDPKLRRWLEIVERSALDGAQTVRRLQDFARVRRDQPKVPVDLRDVVRDALEITQSRWREEALGRGLSIDVRPKLERVPPVAGDPAELREAMTNLILNAVDAMPEGGRLTLTSRVEAGRVEVTVADTGVGIPPEVRDKIFDPFFTTKGPQGTGLGLSMTYGIVARHGGSITVESQPGRGATFRLSFPPSHALEPPPPAADPGAGVAPVALRCLVVDDEETVGAVLGDTLESLGHKAAVLTDGTAAVELARRERFDVVFTDLAMPGVSGWQVAAAVKAGAPDVPVFIVTGFGVEVPAEDQRAHGVDGIFSKPLSIDHVVTVLAQVARARPAGLPEDA